MRDFTLSSYRNLLQALKGYRFISYADYCNNRDVYSASSDRFVILRHDVDLKAHNSLVTARIESEYGIRATYYFRTVPESNDSSVIEAIASLGHEIGYHYEDLTTCNGDVDAAYRSFCENLGYFRQFAPVETICMHGSPKSKWDSKDIWKVYDYHKLGIAGEPYFDTDFSSVFYLTDTGRCWDGYKVSLRDRIPEYQDKWVDAGLVYHSTDDIVAAASSGILPQHIMITTHPQRWNDSFGAWMTEFAAQKCKNLVKYLLNRLR